MYVKQHSTYQPLTPEQARRFLDLTQAELDEALAWIYANFPAKDLKYLDALRLTSLDEIPQSADELEAAMDEAGVAPDRRERLRQQFAAGTILFVIAGLYRASDGAIVDYPRHAVERAIRIARDTMAGDTDDLKEDEVALVEWEKRNMRTMRVLYLVAASFAGGMAASAIDTALRGMAQQYGYLSVMASDIATGKQRPGGIQRRLRRYAGFARAIFQAVININLDALQWPEEMNELGVAEHCSECVELTALGWVPRGTLTPIGSRICGNECKCTIKRRSISGAIVSA